MVDRVFKIKYFFLTVILVLASNIFLLSQNDIEFEYFKKEAISFSQFYSKDELSSNRLILVGETHFQKKNDELFLNNVAYLVEDSIINGILLEEGYCTGYIIEQLVNHNNVELAEENLSNREIKFFQEISKESQLSLKKIIGIDYEKSGTAILQSILHLSKSQTNNSRPKILNVAIENNWDRLYTSKNDEILLGVYSDWQEDTSEYYKHFKANYSVFRLMMDSYKSYTMYSKFDFNECFDSTLIVAREKFMTQNVKHVLDTTEISYYGQFGSLHIPYTTQSKQYFGRCDYPWNSCVSYLSESGYQNEVLSIQLVYRKFGVEFYQCFLDADFQLYSSYFNFKRRGIGVLRDNNSVLFEDTFDLLIFVY